MTGMISCDQPMFEAETTRTCQLTELVRGAEGRLVEEMAPVVRRQNVSLDLRTVERIDAAGIAALISLYRIASEAGHRFSVSNVTPHVRELLSLVGLEKILVSHNEKLAACSPVGFARSAA